MEAPWVQLREDSHGIPMVIPMGIPTEILWEWDGNSIPTATLIITQVFCLKIHGISPACYRLIQGSNCLIFHMSVIY